MPKVLKTRMVGQMPDSRHLMAPPEIVYVVEKEERARMRFPRGAAETVSVGVFILGVFEILAPTIVPLWLAGLMFVVGGIGAYVWRPKRT